MRLFSLLSILTLLLTGCATSSVGTDTTLATTRTPPSALHWGVVGVTDVPTLDPALASDATSISLASLIYGGLVRLDRHLQVRPDGASHWTISRDGKVYTFFLRPNLRFADGRRVRAADFAAALSRSLGPEASAGTASFYLSLVAPLSPPRAHKHMVRGIEVLGASTLRITLTHPAAHFLAELAFPASYVPEPSLVQRYASSWTDHAAGFGPFFVRVWRHSRYLSLQRNPYYYAGKPVLKRISLHFYPEEQDAVRAYAERRLDLVSGLSPGTSLSLSTSGVESVPGLALDYLAFNTARPPFNQVAMRRAFATIKVSQLAAQTNVGTAFAARSLLPSAFHLSVAGWHGHRSASAYLKRAGYMHGRHLPSVRFILPRDPQAYALASALRRAWRQDLHADIILRQLNPSNYSQVLTAHAFDLAFIRWGADYPDPQDFLGTQLGASPDNVTGWSPPRYTRLVQLADSYSPVDPRRVALFARAARLATRELPLLPLDEPAQTAIIRPGLTGVTVTPLGTISGDWQRAGFRS